MSKEKICDYCGRNENQVENELTAIELINHRNWITIKEDSKFMDRVDICPICRNNKRVDSLVRDDVLEKNRDNNNG